MASGENRLGLPGDILIRPFRSEDAPAVVSLVPEAGRPLLAQSLQQAVTVRRKGAPRGKDA